MNDENKKPTKQETKPAKKKAPFLMSVKVAGECAGLMFISGLLIGYGITAMHMRKS